MFEGILMYKGTGQISNPKSQIPNKFQALNLKYKTKKHYSRLNSGPAASLGVFQQLTVRPD